MPKKHLNDNYVKQTVTIAIVLSAFAFSQHATAGGVRLDNSKTAVYKALAQLTFQAFEKNDMETAATLGRVLDRVWDQNEENGEHGLKQTNAKLFEDVDEAMDAFIKPVILYDQKSPDAASVRRAYNSYLEKLKTAD